MKKQMQRVPILVHLCWLKVTTILGRFVYTGTFEATNDLHKDTLGTRNPGLGYMAKRAQPVLYDADTLLHPTHHPVSIWDSEEVLVHQVVSMKKMSEKPGHVRPANGFYDKLNALKFVPQQELSREQAYWLPANERASQTSNPNSPVTPFVRKSRPPSQVLTSLRNVNAVFPQFEEKAVLPSLRTLLGLQLDPHRKPPVQLNKKPNVSGESDYKNHTATEPRNLCHKKRHSEPSYLA
ncbi:hypothetical protein Tco_0667467 [Tanacetum coccineum]